MFESTAYAMAQGGEGAAEGGGMSTMVLFIAIFAIMYFLLIRPQQKKQKEVKYMQQNLKVGDRVTTTGGIQGTVASVSDTIVTLKVAEKVKIDFDRNAIAGIRPAGSETAK